MEPLERLVPGRYRLPLRYLGQSMLGALEPEVKFLPALVRKSSIAVDVGANKGIYTYALAALVEHVYAFEPILEHCRYIGKYKTSKVTVMNVALSDRSGTSTLQIPIDRGRMVTTRASLVRSGGEQRQVEIRSLDSYHFENVGFMKIDVEGSEDAVIAGADRTIRTNLPVLTVEMAFTNGESARCIHIFEHLLVLGYQSVLIESAGVRPCTLDVLTRAEFNRNVTFLPRNHELLRP
jgi:FkbM family methyltransferase